ncbi:hypothetical protein T492DRAFT_928483 [Pavlovales sp. CCMP2436]|nr:hypothetical protein T492DRAFT_928483 [Pavlovales sp. CCMP2436]|mmetsp:Transcript_18450/g.43023  ORF Transcript_18450/g.43023 Transcript_18450/m.43023 type:complete len:450 (+) Transcript_18450:137-1486(+)|eukprot:CAMPEP_0180019764 /NCGR_PEP_ID=MMETSP0984-20121128/21302_1 /TAXON_ID=483367 /ORGANISM="non described non described, Strain CCMP 2436" /LENGTH=449 /DNA_ID=CAMNT_0021943363 /DNA_START=50 /DNA_END=1399 /DNA_ORIENTATION=-
MGHERTAAHSTWREERVGLRATWQESKGGDRAWWKLASVVACCALALVVASAAAGWAAAVSRLQHTALPLPGAVARCAPWVTGRRTLLILANPNRFKTGYKPTGENVLLHKWAEAARANGFRVVVQDQAWSGRLNSTDPSDVTRLIYATTHRLGLDCKALSENPEVACKVGYLGFFGKDPHSRGNCAKLGLTSRQVLTPYPLEGNPLRRSTFLGYWPSAHRLADTTRPSQPRGRRGLLLGKEARYFNPEHPDNLLGSNRSATRALVPDLIRAMLAAGFELSTTCAPRAECNLPPAVRSLPGLGPEEYARTLHRFSFLLGVGDPAISPSPLEALSAGVAYINPTVHGHIAPGRVYQHDPISRLGPPYVFNVELSNISSVIEAAELSARQWFDTYVPAEHTYEATVSRMCQWLSNEQSCACARARRDAQADGGAGARLCGAAEEPGMTSEL